MTHILYQSIKTLFALLYVSAEVGFSVGCLVIVAWFLSNSSLLSIFVWGTCLSFTCRGLLNAVWDFYVEQQAIETRNKLIARLRELDDRKDADA